MKEALERLRLVRLYEAEHRKWRETSEHGHRFEDSRPCEVCGGPLRRTVFLKYDHYGSREDRERWWGTKPHDWTNRVYMKDARDGDDWYLPKEPLFEHEYVEVDGVAQKTRRRYTGEVEELRLPDGRLVHRSRKRRSTTTYEPAKKRKDRFSIPPERRAAWHSHGVWRPDHACVFCGGCLHKFAEEAPRLDGRIAWYQCRHCGIRWVQDDNRPWRTAVHATTKANMLRGAVHDRRLEQSALPSAIASAVGNLMPPVSFEALAEHLRENYVGYNLTDKLIRRGIKLALTTGQISIQPGILNKYGFPFYRHGTREPPRVSATIRSSDVPDEQRSGEKPWLVVLWRQENGE